MAKRAKGSKGGARKRGAAKSAGRIRTLSAPAGSPAQQCQAMWQAEYAALTAALNQLDSQWDPVFPGDAWARHLDDPAAHAALVSVRHMLEGAVCETLDVDESWVGAGNPPGPTVPAGNLKQLADDLADALQAAIQAGCYDVGQCGWADSGPGGSNISRNMLRSLLYLISNVVDPRFISWLGRPGAWGNAAFLRRVGSEMLGLSDRLRMLERRGGTPPCDPGADG